ncbi:MAG TPA: ABC transporter permease [Bryobacterales bacterium]|nr:ABC transporter permease [Bryobacterales bacterium]
MSSPVAARAALPAPRPRFAAALGSSLGPLLGLAAVFLFFALWAGPPFYSWYSQVTVLTQSVIVAAGALGMTWVIIAGGIDLSVGSIIALSTVVIARLLQAGVPPLVSALAGVAVGGLCGLVNGLLITRLGLVPFIITLGTLLVFRGAATGLAREQKIDAPITWLNDMLTKFPAPSWMLVAWGVWLTALLAVVVALLLGRTVLGRYAFAIGSNEQTARLCGVRVERMKLYIYTIGGLLTGFAGLMQFSRLTVGDPTAAKGMELDIIAAVVIGGGSLNGGQGRVGGSLAGALLMTVIRSGLSMKGVPNWVQDVLTGGIIVAAVALDRLRSKGGRSAPGSALPASR